MVTAPTLYQGKLYCLAGCGTGQMHIYSIHIENGTVEWNVTTAGRCNLEANSLVAASNTLVMPISTLESVNGGANGLKAVSTSNGTHLWEFSTDEIFWNFAPSVDEDSLILPSSCGSVYRVSLHTGELIWKTGSHNPWMMCGTGGGALGPNGIFYSEYNLNNTTETGTVAAHDARNGQKLWQRELDKGFQGIQYPSVGRLGPKGKLAVVVGVGENPGLPLPLTGELLQQYLADPELRAEMQAQWVTATMIMYHACSIMLFLPWLFEIS